MLHVPVVLHPKALKPIAVLLDTVFTRKAWSPIAVLKHPVVFDSNALEPKAVLQHPVVLAYNVL